jgi:hypothetical protein
MTDYAFRVIQRGQWLDEPVPTRQERLDPRILNAPLLIRELVYQMVNANIALNLFEEARAQSGAAKQAYKGAMHKPPNRLVTEKPVLCALMFIFALDQISRTLDAHAKLTPHASAKVADAQKKLRQIASHFSDELFRGLKGARDSAHHRYERVIGLALDKPIRPQAIQIPEINLPPGVLRIIDSVIGTSFTCTAKSGEVVQVDVSLASLQKVQTVVQKVIDMFPWKGLPISWPD